MTTRELIDAALAAKEADARAGTDLGLAQAAKARTQAALQAANQALHDDLAANGPAVTVDDSQAPPVVTVYQADEPNTWKAQEIRVA